MVTKAALFGRGLAAPVLQIGGDLLSETRLIGLTAQLLLQDGITHSLRIATGFAEASLWERAG